MKNSYQQRMTRLMAACLLLPASLQAQTATVYTPRGTAVTTNIYAELTSQQIAYFNQSTEANYPLAQRIGDASQRYNCHAYAWYLSEAPNSTPYWINHPEDDKYLDDGSYIQICNESEAAKVSYPYPGDHSATRSIVAGKVDSKWGATPLMRHDPAYAPSVYNPSVRTFYAPTKISGSTAVTCNNESYSVAAFTGGTYTWSASSNITLNTTSGPSITANYNGNGPGPGWIEVNITSSCSISSVQSRINVNAAPTDVTGNWHSSTNPYNQTTPLQTSQTVPSGNITIQTSAGPNTTFSYRAQQIIYNSPPPNVTQSGNTATFNIGPSGTYNERVYLDVTATGPAVCGSTTTTFYFFVARSYYMASPNPTSSEVAVQTTDPTAARTTTAPKALPKGMVAPTDAPFEANLYNSYGTVVKTGPSKQGQVRFDVRDLPNGLYTLRAGTGKEAFSQHIQVAH